jgi:hypothetical protein
MERKKALQPALLSASPLAACGKGRGAKRSGADRGAEQKRRTFLGSTPKNAILAAGEKDEGGSVALDPDPMSGMKDEPNKAAEGRESDSSFRLHPSSFKKGGFRGRSADPRIQMPSNQHSQNSPRASSARNSSCNKLENRSS